MALPKCALFLALVLGMSVASPSLGYDPERHGKYTEAAFTLYHDHCKPALLPCESVGSIVEGAKAEDALTLTRACNWHFYNREGQVRWRGVNRNLDAVFRQRIRKLEKQLKTRKSHPSEIYKVAGQVLHYIQDMTVPAHVVPIYHGPGHKDLVDGYSPDFCHVNSLRSAVQQELGLDLEKQGCERLRPKNPKVNSSDFFKSLLNDTAQTTLRAIGQTKHPDAGSERWLCFWGSSRKPNGFANYGACLFKAGINPESCGGDAALYRCYQDRYRQTLEATMRVLLYLEGRVSRQ